MDASLEFGGDGARRAECRIDAIEPADLCVGGDDAGHHVPIPRSDAVCSGKGKLQTFVSIHANPTQKMELDLYPRRAACQG